MCGITGVIDTVLGQDLEYCINRMADTLIHRGPDDGGVWVDINEGVALGHRRLSILDLSPAGHQPMVSTNGRYVIAFNGEIYNHIEMRRLLRSACNDYKWRGHSDTETLLACFEQWGIEATLSHCVGMFAIALWDRDTRTLTLARDRFGEKPLYYGWGGNAVVFGSELKALRAAPDFSNPVNRRALAEFIRFCYVPAPLSIYEGIYKLEPGCFLTLSGLPQHNATRNDMSGLRGEGAGFYIRHYWSIDDTVKAGQDTLFTDERDALEALEGQLDKAVRLQMLADVPLGAFLSGGIDSSMIVALMQKQSAVTVKTFTVGLEEAGFDESPHARAVAKHLGTDHHELFVSANEAQDVILQLPQMYDEPFADSSQIPTHLVCKMARQHVTVALSGDAGDELFGGYNRYFWGERIWNKLSWMPYQLRKRLGRSIRTVPVRGWDALSGLVGVPRLGDRAYKLSERLSRVRNMDDLYWSLVTEWADPGLVVKGGGSQQEDTQGHGDAEGLSSVERMMYWDSNTYLPDDILCKVDRAAMSASLETRVPFLDHRVAELAWRLPLSMKIRGNEGKWALRQILYKHVPRELIERPKAGFAIPVGQWIRGPLREWAEALLSQDRLEQEGYFYPVLIRQKWVEHLSGRHDHTPSLWSILMFQSWLEAND